MESLLRWSIEHSTPGAQPPEPRRDIDPGIIDAILGRPESELMKEALVIAVDDEKDEDTRLGALDDFEMLIESIDNANNIASMNMWKPIQNLLSADSSTDDIRASVLWIIGTAIQNNPAAQIAYMSSTDSPLKSILSYVSSNEASSKTRSRAMYALSGLLKHNAKAVNEMSRAGGWDVLKATLEDPDISVRRKAVFLINALLLPYAAGAEPVQAQSESDHAPVHSVHPHSHASMSEENCATSAVTSQALHQHGLIKPLVQSLVNPVPHGEDGEHEGDADYEEKLVRLLLTYLTDCGGILDTEDKADVSKWIMERSDKGEQWDLGSKELEALHNALS